MVKVLIIKAYGDSVIWIFDIHIAGIYIIHMTFYNRQLGTVIKQAMSSFPAIVVTGPRQSGKTTLLQHISRKTHKYISLEDPDVRAQIKNDPRGFFALHKGNIFIDEIQYLPEILQFIKTFIDKTRIPGQWLLSGSQHFSLMAGISESLAGRAAILSLLPFGWNEFHKSKQLNPGQTAKQMLRGFYPEPITNQKVSRKLWCSSYVQTYLERDVRMITQVSDLATFEKFLRLLAVRTGQILNLSEFGREIGVSHKTAQRWINLLQTSDQVYLLQPYFKNFGKRIIKSSKVYFLDTGLASYLFGLHDPLQLQQSPYWGNLFETMVISEWVKAFRHTGHLPPIYFWRNSDGCEVDLIVDYNGQLHPFEVKSTQTPTPIHAGNIVKLQKWGNNISENGYVLCNISSRQALSQDITAEPWAIGIKDWMRKNV